MGFWVATHGLEASGAGTRSPQGPQTKGPYGIEGSPVMHDASERFYFRKSIAMPCASRLWIPSKADRQPNQLQKVVASSPSTFSNWLASDRALFIQNQIPGPGPGSKQNLTRSDLNDILVATLAYHMTGPMTARAGEDGKT